MDIVLLNLLYYEKCLYAMQHCRPTVHTFTLLFCTATSKQTEKELVQVIFNLTSSFDLRPNNDPTTCVIKMLLLPLRQNLHALLDFIINIFFTIFKNLLAVSLIIAPNSFPLFHPNALNVLKFGQFRMQQNSNYEVKCKNWEMIIDRWGKTLTPANIFPNPIRQAGKRSQVSTLVLDSNYRNSEDYYYKPCSESFWAWTNLNPVQGCAQSEHYAGCQLSRRRGGASKHNQNGRMAPTFSQSFWTLNSSGVETWAEKKFWI